MLAAEWFRSTRRGAGHLQLHKCHSCMGLNPSCTEACRLAFHVTQDLPPTLRDCRQMSDQYKKLVLGRCCKCTPSLLDGLLPLSPSILTACTSLTLCICRQLSDQYKKLVLEQKALTEDEFWSSSAVLKVAGVAGAPWDFRAGSYPYMPLCCRASCISAASATSAGLLTSSLCLQPGWIGDAWPHCSSTWQHA
jgi:hypothetical protein